MCDRIGWLDHGDLRALGPAGQVIDDYIDETHVDRAEAVDGAGARWGSGEGRIERIELLDAEGTPTTKVRTGDTVTIRFHYATDEAIEKPVFGLAIHSLDDRLHEIPLDGGSNVDIADLGDREALQWRRKIGERHLHIDHRSHAARHEESDQCNGRRERHDSDGGNANPGLLVLR